MNPFHFLTDFMEPIRKQDLLLYESYNAYQIGYHIQAYETVMPILDEVDMIIIGCVENRGTDPAMVDDDAPNAIRKAFYELYHWHTNIRIADIGNVKQGATLADSYAALTAVVKELLPLKKKIVIIGGSHDVTLGQYHAYKALDTYIELCAIDACIDLEHVSNKKSDCFLLEMLTTEPNYVKHYNHIGFQSYYVHPHVLETIDKLRLDCYRLGKVKECIEEMEPVLRESNMLSIDIAAIQHSCAPANTLSPNGLTGEEICTLMQYAGMSNRLSSVGIYGFLAENDMHHLTAKQISQMLWYFMDGMNRGKQEAFLEDREYFNEFHVAFAETSTHFLQSKRTGRWWMQLLDHSYIACSHDDYIQATQNNISERWLRAQERL